MEVPSISRWHHIEPLSNCLTIASVNHGAILIPFAIVSIRKVADLLGLGLVPRATIAVKHLSFGSNRHGGFHCLNLTTRKKRGHLDIGSCPSQSTGSTVTKTPVSLQVNKTATQR